MSDTARKAVITTAQVQEALDRVNANYKTLYPEWLSYEFDKGHRGRGFAQYNPDGSIVRSFDTKEDALGYFTSYADGMDAVLVVLPKAETPESKPKTTRKPAETNAA